MPPKHQLGLLTISQVLFLAGALPRPQAGQYTNGTQVFANSTEVSAAETTVFPAVNITCTCLNDTIATARVSEVDVVTLTDDVIVNAIATTYQTSFVTSVITIDGDRVLTSTSLPDVQTPTATSATGTAPDTTGIVNATLETSGANTAYPFPTLIAGTVTTATLSPLDTSFPFANATETGPETTTTQTVTIPTTTHVTSFETITAFTTTVWYIETITSYTTLAYPTRIAGELTTTSTTSILTSTWTTSVVVTTTVTARSTSSSIGATTVTTGSAFPSAISRVESDCTDTMGCDGQNIFLPVAVGDIPSNIERRSDHPVARLGINNQTTPTETNKFYANFFLGSQTDATFVHPYSLAWSAGTGNAMSYGMAISHVDDDQKVFGPARTDIPGSPASYYINPLAIQSIILSAVELGSTTVLTSDTLLAFSANINLQPENYATSKITFPVVQGMGFVTALYTNLQPAVQSSVFFRTVTSAGSPKAGVYKYRVTLEDGKYWLIYVTPSDGVDPNFQLQSNTLLQGLPGFNGIIQVAKNPGNASESIYDAAAGVYPTSATITGYASGSLGTYSFAWSKGGSTWNTVQKRAPSAPSNSTLLMFALPHHVQSMDSVTKGKLTSLELQTTTKGVATAVLADSWTLEEPNLPISMGFAPWRPNSGSQTNLSQEAVAAINEVAAVEISQNMTAQADLNSMYYAGKALSKFAQLVWTVSAMGQNDGLAAAGLANLKAAFAIFVNQQQQYPLVYDTVWGGVVSSASYVTGDSGEDFGNTYYNDHHFHYGYHVHAAAVIGALDPTWLVNNKDYVNTLVRDVSNPSLEDSLFPFSRSFDWFHGHSWAKGLFESGDSKDQESTSEDAMFAYALKMWGQTVGDASMEARGNVMLAIAARSYQNYFLLESTNTNQPANFIGNKVTGILFDNKVDHTTYFGTNLEYIQGIHMLPLMPYSTLTRTTNFVSEEWDTYFANGSVDPAPNVTGGWKGLLYANLAIIDPSASWNFFNQSDFDASWLDGGASRTWYLAYAAGLSSLT